MSMFHCVLCSSVCDSDYIECYEWDTAYLVCEACHCKYTPANWEEWQVSENYSNPLVHRYEIVHQDYDGAPIDSFGPPADGRFFTGPTLLDVWIQARDYETDQS